jgi:hypothetical protein
LHHAGGAVLKSLRFFGYFFFMHSIFGLGVIYTRDNFRKPFGEFDALDIVRTIILLIIMWSYFWLAADLFIRFEDIPRRSKVFIVVASLLVSMITVGFLLSVYIDVLSQ